MSNLSTACKKANVNEETLVKVQFKIDAQKKQKTFLGT